MAEKTTNYNLTKPSADDFYDVGVQNGNMDIVDGELKRLNDGKAPAGHGLGSLAYGKNADNFNSIFNKGGGFYSITSETDAPDDLIYWFSVFQNLRGLQTEDKPTGAQLAILDYFDYTTAFPRMWLRTASQGNLSNWYEMLHTGNYSKFANARISMGSYVGVANSTNQTKEVMLSFDFEPKLVILQGMTQSNRIITTTLLRGCDGRSMYGINKESTTIESVSAVWAENSVKFSLDASATKNLNWTGNTYTYVAIG